MKKIFLGLVLGTCLFLLVGNLSGKVTENLVPSKQFTPAIPGKRPNVFWWSRTANASFRNGVLKLYAQRKSTEACHFRINVINEIANSVQFKLNAKVEGGNGVATLSFITSQNKPIKRKSFKINSQEWQKFSLTTPFPKNTADVSVTFTAKEKGCKFFIKNVSVKLVSSDTVLSKKIKIQSGNSSVKCSGIYIIKSTPGKEFYDKKAAKLLRKYLYNITGDILPLKIVSDVKNATKPGAILLGQAATKSGLIQKGVLNNLKPGGYAININNGIVSLAGTAPTGIMNGTYALLEKLLNIVFVSEYATEPEISKRNMLVFKKGSFAKSPAFELRYIRNGDALGYSAPNVIADAGIIGCNNGRTCHTAEGLVDFDKYHKTHPEYFSLGKNGKRLQRDPSRNRFDVHFCMSNPDVKKLIASQVIAWMKACPQSKYFWITQGDCRGLYCTCKNCKAMDEKSGNYTDRNIKFVNSIAKLVAEKYPDNVILTLAYTDIEEPPAKTRPVSNVGIMYCPYPRNWSNHLKAFDKKYNAQGIRTLEGWLKCAPKNMYIFCYPSACAEALNLWPAFYANYEKFIYYSKHNIKGIFFCGLTGVRRGGRPASNSFNAMSRFVLDKVLWNPSIDVEKEIDYFMKLYYGPAAPYMRDFFNLIHKEVKDRHFAQHTEETKRGFVTKSLAEKGYAIFAKAEKSVAGKKRFLNRVLREKLYLLFSDLSDRCRTNGKIKEKEFPFYSKKLAEFAKLCKKFKIDYFRRKKNPQGWFWDTALLKIPKRRDWYNTPVINSLIKKPLETINDSMVMCQEKIKNGYSISCAGLCGAIKLKTYAYKCPRRDNVKILRRPTSGYGYAMTQLRLKTAPPKAMKLEMEGLDNEKNGKAFMRLKINGKVIYKGKVPFLKKDWSWHSFDIPSSILKKGKNLIELENITPDIVTEEEKKAVDYIVGRKKNYYWGWYIISGLRITAKK
jgi:Domain of unknown function (DUF4838)